MRVYRVLLHLYPASFRAEYGEEMAAIFRRRLRDADGPFARLALWISVAWETIMNALAVHWDILRQDLRYTARTLSRARGFAVDRDPDRRARRRRQHGGLLADRLRPLPPAAVSGCRPSGHALAEPGGGTRGWSCRRSTTSDWKDAAHVVRAVGMYTNTAANLVGSGDPERLRGAAVSADLFPVLGVPAALGRTFGGGRTFW